MTNIAPVGSVTAGNGKWGQADLGGNVWEWTQDWYFNGSAGLYIKPCDNCANLTDPPMRSRVFRGGSFVDHPSDLRSWFRAGTPSQQNYAGGARCARTP